MAGFGETKTTQTTTIPGAGGAEQSIIRLLQQLAQQSGGQLGDLSKLAAGDIGGPTGQDMQLIADSIGRIAEITNREIARSSQQGQAQLGEQLLGRGVSGSSSESVQRAILESGLQDQLANTLSRAQAQGSQTALQLPFQRAGLQLSANQQLFNQLIGAGLPVAQMGLQERIAQPTTTQTQEQGFGFNDIVALGSIAAAPFTGGASLAGLGLASGGGGGGGISQGPGGLVRVPTPGTQGGFRTFDPNNFIGPR
jgi:hypothetical protein